MYSFKRISGRKPLLSGRMSRNWPLRRQYPVSVVGTEGLRVRLGRQRYLEKIQKNSDDTIRARIHKGNFDVLGSFISDTGIGRNKSVLGRIRDHVSYTNYLKNVKILLKMQKC